MKHWILSMLLTSLSLASWGASCSISLPTGELGQYNPEVNTAGVTVLQAFWINCPPDTLFEVSAGQSSNPSKGGYRQMKNTSGSGFLMYQMCPGYSAPTLDGCTIIFGDGTTGVKLYGKASVSQQGMYFYIHVKGGQIVPPGEYVDYVSISINP
nr:spore coat protein U domain-containing protein [uncultured Deefgea sp.]